MDISTTWCRFGQAELGSDAVACSHWPVRMKQVDNDLEIGINFWGIVQVDATIREKRSEKTIDSIV
jgi:hypothetical protein